MDSEHIHIDMPDCRFTATIMTILLSFSAIKDFFAYYLGSANIYYISEHFAFDYNFISYFISNQLHTSIPWDPLINVTVKHVRITKERNINCQNVIHRTYFK